MALGQLREAAELLNLDPGMTQVLENARRCLVVSLPVKMDDGTIRVF